MDILDHYRAFLDLQDYPCFDDFIFYLTVNLKSDSFLYFFYWFIGKFTSVYQVIGFCSAFVLYYLLIQIADKWLDYLHVSKNGLAFILLLGSFLALTCIYDFNGMRNATAIVFFVYLIINKEKYPVSIFWVLLLLDCLIHFSMYPIVGLYLISCYLSSKTRIAVVVLLIIGHWFFLPLMEWLMNILPSYGQFGMIMSLKIYGYLFSGEEGAAFYSGSILRFLLICCAFAFSPIVVIAVKRHERELDIDFCRFHYFVVLFIAYIFWGMDSYLLARNFMLFRYLFLLYLAYLIYCGYFFSKRLRSLFFACYVMIALSGIPSFILGKEYQVLNFDVFTSNLYAILTTQVSLEGYDRI